MKTKLFALLICSSVMAACSSNRSAIPEGAADTSAAPMPKTTTAFDAQRDGSSFDHAIIIEEKNESSGLQAENTQLTTLYPGSKRVSQRYEMYKNKQHEVVNITTQDGREVSVYFDVSNYFGKQ